MSSITTVRAGLPKRLFALPNMGKVLVANPRDQKAAWGTALREGVDYFLSERVKAGELYLCNLDFLHVTEPVEPE